MHLIKLINKMSAHIFGPVPSRRLGLSLGVDLLPYKTCSLDCIYCECGETTNLTSMRKKWFDTEEILAELTEKMKKIKKLDFITFSGSGEPTLAKNIGELIKKIKNNFSIPVCVLTNGTLLYRKSVQKNLLNADIVLPSLDAVSEPVFRKINRPEKTLTAQKLISGLIEFRKIYKGKIYLEILFVKNINDTEKEIKKLAAAADKIKPDKIQLNTCVRPGSQKNLMPLTKNELLIIAESFNFPVDLISSFSGNNRIEFNYNDISEMIKRRPCTIRDMTALTGLPSLQIVKILDFLICKGVKIKNRNNNFEKYFFIEE